LRVEGRGLRVEVYQGFTVPPHVLLAPLLVANFPVSTHPPPGSRSTRVNSTGFHVAMVRVHELTCRPIVGWTPGVCRLTSSGQGRAPCERVVLPPGTAAAGEETAGNYARKPKRATRHERERPSETRNYPELYTLHHKP
jgi:hypothetical protein